MKILLIGGPKFLGRHLTAAALAAGHEITHFNRGNYSAHGLPQIETIAGDRYHDLNKLSGREGRKWDAVIDTCGYLPDNVKAAAGALADHVDRYIFISSISAYSDFSKIDFDESAPPAVLTEEQRARADATPRGGEITAFKLGDLYGPLKAECEHAVEDTMPGRTIVIRPGLIVGAFDTTDRFPYWVTRVAGGGEVLAPGDPKRFVQLIDARDLSAWTIKLIEDRESGVYNATGKPFALTMENMLWEIKEATGSDASFVWANEEFLIGEEVQPWSEMPFYLPESSEDSQGFLSANIDRATGKGLKFRPLKETISDTLKWAEEHLAGKTLKAGISAEKEAELIGKLRSPAAN
jgi:2'-hydroxyisoflavone reductase